MLFIRTKSPCMSLSKQHPHQLSRLLLPEKQAAWKTHCFGFSIHSPSVHLPQSLSRLTPFCHTVLLTQVFDKSPSPHVTLYLITNISQPNCFLHALIWIPNLTQFPSLLLPKPQVSHQISSWRPSLTMPLRRSYIILHCNIFTSFTSLAQVIIIFQLFFPNLLFLCLLVYCLSKLDKVHNSWGNIHVAYHSITNA